VAGILNFFLKKPFPSNAFGWMTLALGAAFLLCNIVDSNGRAAAFGSMISYRVLPASLLVTMAILVLTAIALSLATRLDAVPTLSICTAVFLVGLMSDYLFGRTAPEHGLAAFCYALIPNWQHFWAADGLTGKGTVPWGYVLDAGGYGLLYLAAVLFLGMVAFRHMEIRS
jgi:hypothetical protein